jgi:hypothetical protein
MALDNHPRRGKLRTDSNLEAKPQHIHRWIYLQILTWMTENQSKDARKAVEAQLIGHVVKKSQKFGGDRE